MLCCIRSYIETAATFDAPACGALLLSLGPFWLPGRVVLRSQTGGSRNPDQAARRAPITCTPSSMHLKVPPSLLAAGSMQ